MERFFTADYRDGRVRIGDKTYAACAYAVHLLNQYYKNDTALRLSVYKQHGWNVSEQLSIVYLKASDFIAAGVEIQHIIDVLSGLKPFDKFDIDGERNRVSNLFSEENADQIIDFSTAVPQPNMQFRMNFNWIYYLQNMIKTFSEARQS